MENLSKTLVQNFRDYFSVELASVAAQKQAVYGIRYRVYCEELKFEPAERFPDRLEHDEFDDHSLHCLVTHKRSGLAAGCIRLVEAGEGLWMPMEKYCRDSLNIDYAGYLYEDRGRVCEFSRMAVDATFRRRLGETHTRIGEVDALDCTHQEHRTFSLIGIAALLASFAMADLTGRHAVFGMMERYLPRLLRRSGILIHQAGQSMDYHGKRAPYFSTTEMVVENMQPDLLELYRAIHADFSPHFKAHKNVA